MALFKGVRGVINRKQYIQKSFVPIGVSGLHFPRTIFECFSVNGFRINFSVYDFWICLHKNCIKTDIKKADFSKLCNHWSFKIQVREDYMNGNNIWHGSCDDSITYLWRMEISSKIFISSAMHILVTFPLSYIIMIVVYSLINILTRSW